MPVLNFTELTFRELRGLERVVAILPTGATEAHGPHLPLGTDVLISEAMAQHGAELLSASGHTVLLMPPLHYTAAPFAADFCGTISVRPETVTALIVDIANGLLKCGVSTLVLANSHLDPTHLRSLYAAVKAVQEPLILFPDITRKPWALRLTDEFKSGACHAGQYETSVVMACRRDLVRDEIRRSLVDNPNSLSAAIHQGKTTFEQAGGPEAYFGYPERASAAEGANTIAVLGQILAEAVLEA